MKPQWLFDGALLRASVFNPGQARLFVSFRQRIDAPGTFVDPRPVRSFTREGMTHLHLQSLWNDWYINDETRALEAQLFEFASKFTHSCAMGFSMGGYAMLRFAAALRLKQIIAISPQYSISPDHVPFDRRYRKYSTNFDADLGDLKTRATLIKGVILADPYRPLDIRNAELIRDVFPGLALARLAAGGHPATGVLGEGRKIGRLQGLLLKPKIDRRRVVMLHRNSRRNSPKYWRHLAMQARKASHNALADVAEKRAEALAGPDA